MFQPNNALLPHFYNNLCLALLILLTMKEDNNNVQRRENKFHEERVLNS